MVSRVYKATKKPRDALQKDSDDLYRAWPEIQGQTVMPWPHHRAIYEAFGREADKVADVFQSELEVARKKHGAGGRSAIVSDSWPLDGMERTPLQDSAEAAACITSLDFIQRLFRK